MNWARSTLWDVILPVASRTEMYSLSSTSASVSSPVNVAPVER
jgi:hypothetical protein